MSKFDLRNDTGLQFTDISSEAYRSYTFPAGEKISIQEPQFLNVSASGHRLVDGEGVCHYVPKGWLHLSWKVRENQPHFVK